MTGRNFESDDRRTPAKGGRATTGAYSPFGTPTQPGQAVAGNDLVHYLKALRRQGPRGA